MKTQLLLRIRVVVIVAVTIVFAGQTNGQETKELRKVTKSKTSPGVFVFQDDKTSDHQVDVVKSNGNVFIVRKQDSDDKTKKDNQKIRWEFKTDGDESKQNNQKFHWEFKLEGDHHKQQNKVVRLRELDGKPGQHVIVIQEQDGGLEKRARRIQVGDTSEQSQGVWVEKGGVEYQLLLTDDKGNIRKILREDKPHSHDQKQDEHSQDSLSDHDHSGHQQEAHEEHQHSGHDGHDDFHLEGAEEIHKVIARTLKEHGLSLNDKNIDVRVEKSDDGKTRIRITAQKNGGNKRNVEKRIQMRVEQDNGHLELHAPHDGDQNHKIEIRTDGDSKTERRRVEKRTEIRRRTDLTSDDEINVEVEISDERDTPRADRPKPPTPPKPPARRIVEDRRKAGFGPNPSNRPGPRGQDRVGPRNFDERLKGMEKQLESLERKLDILIRNLESNRVRSGQRGTRNRGGSDRRNEDPDTKRDDNQRRAR